MTELFDTRGWTLRVGDSDPIELMDRVSDLGFTRGPHGPGELHATLPLDWSPLLPVEAQIARGVSVALWDGPTRLIACTLSPPVPNVAERTLELSGVGDLERGNNFANYGLLETDCDYDVWVTDIVSRTTGNTKYETDTTNRLRITLPARSTVRSGAAENLIFMLPTWMTWAYIVGFDFTWTLTDADYGPWTAYCYFRTAPGVTAGQEAHQITAAAGGPTAASYHTHEVDMRCIEVRLENTADYTVDTTTKRELTLVDICVYGCTTMRAAPDPHTLAKQRVDEIIGHVLLDTGMATTVNVPDGDPLLTSDPFDTFAKMDRTTPTEVCAAAAAMHTSPVEWVCDAGVATINERPTAGTRERTFVAYVAPVSDDQCSCSGESIVTDSESGFYDFVALSYLCKGDAVYPDGVEMVTIWPASPAPVIGDRILPSEYPQEANVTEAVASAYAEQLFGLLEDDAPYGDIPLDDYFICNVNGVPYPVSHLHEGDWIKVADDPRCPVEGWYITGTTVGPIGDATLHVGGAETALAAVLNTRHRRYKPRRHRGKKRSWHRHRSEAWLKHHHSKKWWEKHQGDDEW